MTDSRLSVGWKIVPWIWAFCGLSTQLSFDVISAPFGPWSSRTGSCKTRATGSPALARDGPMPRRTTDFDVFPRMMKPPIMTLSPVSTRNRVEMFNAWAGVEVGVVVGVAEAIGVTVGDAVAVAVGDAVAVAVGVAVAVAVGVAVAVAVGVAVAVAVGVAVGVAVAVAVAVGVGVGVPAPREIYVIGAS